MIFFFDVANVESDNRRLFHRKITIYVFLEITANESSCYINDSRSEERAFLLAVLIFVVTCFLMRSRNSMCPMCPTGNGEKPPRM